ncbi:MAG: hypothetical protein LBC27_00460 [Spirochaetaceae bacterium]|nr:hypothetical protein [Spirochaetaceae bacterium]
MFNNIWRITEKGGVFTGYSTDLTDKQREMIEPVFRTNKWRHLSNIPDGI